MLIMLYFIMLSLLLLGFTIGIVTLIFILIEKEKENER